MSIAVHIVGNLTADPELRYTPQGAAIAQLRVASTERYRDGDNWKDGATTFLTCNVWRDLGQHAAASLSKGDRVVIDGRLRMRSYEAKDAEGVSQGQRTVYEVEVDEVSPSLRFATAAVERTRRGGRDEAPFPEEPWAAQNGAPSSSNGDTLLVGLPSAGA